MSRTLVNTITDNRKNYIINGGFDFWQRGTSTTTPNSYLADRFLSSSGVEIYSRQSKPSGVNLDTKFFVRISRSTTTTAPVELITRLEQQDVFKLSGKKVTLSFKAKTVNTTPIEIRVRVGSAGATDDFSTVNLNPAVVMGTLDSANTSFQKFTYTFTVDSNMAKNGLQINIGHDNIAGPYSFDLAEVMLVEGSSAPTTFIRAGKTIGDELSLCQRYYEISHIPQRTYSGQYSSISNSFHGHAVSYKVEKRTIPTATFQYGGVDSSYWVIASHSSYSANTTSGIIIRTTIDAWELYQSRTPGGNTPVNGAFYLFENSFNILLDAEL